MFLSKEQIEQLTGRRRPSAQIRWLNQNRWAFSVTAEGRPTVAIAEAERQMCTGRGQRQRPAGEPNLAALDGLG